MQDVPVYPSAGGSWLRQEDGTLVRAPAPEPAPPETVDPYPWPTEGGSFERHPDTGVLTKVEDATHEPDATAETSPAADPPADPIPQSDQQEPVQ